VGSMLGFANIFPSIPNFLMIGLMATLFIHLAKYLFVRVQVPGVTEVFTSI